MDRFFKDRDWKSLLGDAILTLAALLIIYICGRAALSFLIWHAASPFSGSAETCRASEGACWPFIAAKLPQLLFGRYPEAEYWRAGLAVLIPPVGLGIAALGAKRWGIAGYLLAILLSLPLSLLLLAGGFLGLSNVKTDLWGGLTLTLLVAYTGFAASLPLSIVLALARRSSWPVPRFLAIGAIEFWRGVPLVTVLFMANVMLPLFLPEGVSVNKLARALAAIAIFASAYMAEVVRGGLQSVDEGQVTAAQALGLTYAQSLRFIILPQALVNALPGIAGTLIGLLKDTTLVLVIGLFDFLGMLQAASADPSWSAPSTALTGYVFAALVFWCLCFSLSRFVSLGERRKGR